MYSLFLFILLVCSLFAEDVLFSGESFSIYKHDFFQQISYNEWVALDSLKKDSFLSTFIEKELSYQDALLLGLDVFPVNNKKLQERFRQLLINSTYESMVAFPMISERSLALAKKHLFDELLVYHLLVGYSGCALPSAPERTQEEALNLSLGLKQSLSSLLSSSSQDSLLSVFSDFSTQFSDDPSVASNRGLIGWVSWGRVVASFQEAAFNLAPFVLSEPVLTPYGYHLIFVKEKRASQYAFYNPVLVDAFSKKLCLQALSFDSLRAASVRFDSSLVGSGLLKFNRPAIDSLLLIVDKKTNEGRLRGNKSSYVSWFKESPFRDVLFVYDGRGFGVGWLLNALKRAPATRIPQIKTSGDLTLMIKTFLLQDLVFNLGLSSGVSESPFFKNEFLKHKKTILKSEYLSFLINSIVSPDSSFVYDVYLSGMKKGDYMQPQSVLYSEVRTSFEEDISRAYDSFVSFGDFDSLLVSFSGGSVGPIFQGTGGPLAALAFTMVPGQVSSPFENADKSFSIIRVDSFVEPAPFPFDRVYKQIERKLIKFAQDSIKTNLVFSLKNKFNINSVLVP